jgi:uncharacterized membrane protein YedE/YeeE|tara:strand:- start:1229 stop:2395 length:1167 start_codon:yes stop_codon:yes gene_type:complete
MTQIKKIDFFTLSFGFVSSIFIVYFLKEIINFQHSLIFVIGLLLGFTLYHASFGFTGGWRNFIEKSDSSALRAQFLMLAFAILLFSGIVNSKSIFYGNLVIGSIAPTNISVIIGSFIFGFAMQLAGGCGSGTLFTLGGGNTKMFVTLIFFIVGSLVGTYNFTFWLDLPSLGNISLLKKFGIINTVLIQLIFIGLLYILCSFIDKKRNTELNHSDIFLSSGFNAIKGPWPLFLGAILLAILNFLMLNIAGHPWSVTFAFGLWGAKIASFIGIDVASWDFWNFNYPKIALKNSIFADHTSITNIGIILGAVIASSFAGLFSQKTKINYKIILAAIVGGFFMGFGARLAFGCNIGALFSGIASGSLHGWTWFLFAFIGTYFGVKARRLFYS